MMILSPALHQKIQDWLNDAITAGVIEPYAMVLATSDGRARVSSRMVLLKALQPRGLVFATNFQSSKAKHLALNPQACLLFWWDQLHRQIRIEGEVAKLASTDSDAIFAARPRAAQINAISSPQSQPIASRDTLLHRQQQTLAKYADRADIPRPDYWGAYILEPKRVEFWQGERDRLHHREQYDYYDNRWHTQLLAP